MHMRSIGCRPESVGPDTSPLADVICADKTAVVYIVNSEVCLVHVQQKGEACTLLSLFFGQHGGYAG